MHGVILNVGSAQSLILGDDGQRYAFTPLGWGRDDVQPQTGMRVDFEVQGTEAADVYPITDATTDAPPVDNIPATPTPTPTPPPTTPDAPPAAPPPSGDPGGRRRLYWALAGAGALVVVAVVAFALGVFGSSDPPDEIVQAPAASSAPTPQASERQPTEVARAAAPAATPVLDQPPFKLEWQASASDIEAGESFTLDIRMYDVQQAGEHGGVSVSFPSLTELGGSSDGHSSSIADVEALGYTSGLSNVAFHQPGATIYHRENNRQFSAEYLLVESDDPSWSSGSDRTLQLRVTPKRAGEFPIQIRGWLCADEYTGCSRQPGGASVADQQGWSVEQASVSVIGTPAPERIAFVGHFASNSEIYVMNADGSGVTRLTHNEVWDTGPSLSPDGRRIAFESTRDGDFEIYVMNADGSDVTQLTHNEVFDGGPSWSPDGRRIVFRSTRDGDYEIYVMNADGSGVTQLTHNEADEISLGWSPDGRRIGFISDRDGDSEIYVMNADGSNVTQLTHNEAGDGGPFWSPDGRRIAFVSDIDGDFEIYVMNADGSGQRQLTHSDAADGNPRWSPDGEHIAFVSKRDGNWEIYVMNADGSGVTRLTHNEVWDYVFGWLPDGRRIMFSSDRDDRSSEIYMMNADGSDVRWLTNR